MTDNRLEYRTVSQCVSSDWCEGYNEAVKLANDIIAHQQNTIGDLQKVGEHFANTVRENAQIALEVTLEEIAKAKCEAYFEFAKKVKESASHGWNKSIDEIFKELSATTNFARDDKLLNEKIAVAQQFSSVQTNTFAGYIDRDERK